MVQAYDAIIATIVVASDATSVTKAMVKSTQWRAGTSGTWLSTDCTLTAGNTYQFRTPLSGMSSSYIAILPNIKASVTVAWDTSATAISTVGDYFMYYYAQGCSNLTSLGIPDTSGLTSVGSNFMRSYGQYCTSLTSLGIPDTSGLTSVGTYFMYAYAADCSNLTSLSIPDTSSMTTVGTSFMAYYANNCNVLTSLILPSSTGWFGSHNIDWSVPSDRLGLLYGYAPNSTSQTAWRGLTTSGKTLYTNYIQATDHVLTIPSSERFLRSIGGGVVSSERGIYTTSGASQSERGIYSYGKPNPVAIPFYQGKNEKKYSVKIYDRAGTTFKGNYDPIGGYAFTKTINGGVGALSITLPRKFDNFGLGEDVNLLDEIQVWVQDKDTSGKRIYSGYVSSITSFIDGSNQGIKLDVLGYVSRLAFTLDWNGTDISMARNSLTAGELVKDVIDKYRSTVSEERINYGSSTVDITGSDISYTSNAKSCLETIERAREMAGATWYWYVDADNVFYFREYATTPTHLFTFGKDISSLEITRSADDIKNEFIFWNGLMADDTNFISNRYYNTTSINSYWNRFEANTDGRVTTSAGADALGDSYINAYKNPNVSMRFEVKDNNLGAGYDIESIEPGHTCKILNLNDSDVVGDNMVITSVQYTPEKVIIYVSDLREMTGRSLTNLRRQLDTTVYGDRPAKLTSKAIT